MLYLIVPHAAWLQLKALNTVNPKRVLQPMLTVDGRWVLNADLLADIDGETATWTDRAEILRNLETVELSAADFPISGLAMIASN